MERLIRKGFRFDKRCKICTAKDPRNKDNDLRPIVETMKAQGKSNREIIEWSIGAGYPLNNVNLVNHFKRHAPYIVKGSELTPTTKRVITKLTMSSEESVNALRKIIAMGSTMIDNWWNGIDGPQMEVSPKMFIEALKEEGKRAPKTALDQEFESLQKEAIEGEVVS